MDIEALKVPPERLTCPCDPDALGFETADQVGPLEGTVGQDRAVSALDFGLGIDEEGYNIYVAGFPGTGRTTTLEAFLKRVASVRPVPNDWCYVHNFHNSLEPIAVPLPAGRGREFVRDMDELLRECLRDIPRAFESPEYRARVEEAMHEFEQERERISGQIETTARDQGFHVQPSPMGILTAPIRKGQVLSREEFNALPEEEKRVLREKSEALQEYINEKILELRRLEREAARKRAEVDREVTLAVVAVGFQDLQERYQGIPRIVDYLEDVRRDVAEHVNEFRITEEQASAPQPQAPEAAAAKEAPEAERFVRYRVNVLVDNSKTQGAPVVFEYSPTYYNLFGRVEYQPRYGTAATDLTMVRPGAVHQADGGYLVLQARDVLSSPMVWETLKRVLRSGEVRVENIGEQFSPLPFATLRPQPIPLRLKVILMGSPLLLQMLQRLDEDFRKLFKVRADFDLSMERTPENVQFYASFVCNRCRDLKLLPFHKSAVARLVEHSSRLVENQERLTTRFIEIADLVTEANYWAQQAGASLVSGEHVAKAIQERVYRSNLVEERIKRLINDGTLRINTDGEVVGQVNGMSVLDLGDYVFGRPMRITARTSLGRGDVASVDRETQMTGRIHNKGFLILMGYLTGKYGQDKPLSIHSTIGFEQSYDEVEGDSASSAELYALLSTLSGLPIRQSLAVTGSVNQRGEVQAIGGATFKIEGFFDVCKAQGLTQHQGVVLPRDNIKSLVLREDVIQAVRDGKFTIYAVDNVEQGMEVLTGVPAGEPDEKGEFPDGTMNFLITKRLKELAAKAREMGGRGGDGKEPSGATLPE